MNQLFQKPFRTLYAVLVFYGAVSLFTLASWGVIESSEARYAEISREMAESGDWMNPTLLDIHHYHKPPLTYWITAVGYKIFGVNAFGARFFLLISFLIQICLVYRIASTIFGAEKAGLLSAIMYSFLPIVVMSVRGLTTDAYLNTFVLATIACWLRWRIKKKAVWIYSAAFMLGLAFL